MLTENSDFDVIKIRVIFASESGSLHSLNRYSITLNWVVYF